jgi:hypothetical protein
MTEEERSFLESLQELHAEIAAEAVKPSIDPGHLMRLMALGINHCMAGIAALLGEPEPQVEPQAEDPQQLRLPFWEKECSRCELDSTSGPGPS